MLEEMAEVAVRHNADCEAGMRQVMCEAAYGCLVAHGYTPPEAEEFTPLWGKLLDLLAGRAKAQEQGSAWDDPADFDADIDEVKTALTGGA
jgi:hypothetical protein